VTVALGGDGGDELFMGYPTFDAVLHAARLQRLSGWACGALRVAADRLPASTRRMSAGFLARQFLKGLDYPPPIREQVWLGSFSREEQSQLLAGEARHALLVDDPFVDLVREVAAAGAPTPVDAAAYHHLRYYLSDGVLAKVDRASMANSLEVRAPLLDPAVVELAARIPYAWKIGQGGKRILKRALAPLLPTEILRRGKQGFGIPLTAWLRRELVPLCDELLDPAHLRRQGIFDPAYVSRLLQEHRTGLRDHRKPLWTLLAFQLWWQGEAVRGRGSEGETGRQGAAVTGAAVA
jgi:asparagine synthase (glutamine-hydrolysing)